MIDSACARFVLDICGHKVEDSKKFEFTDSVLRAKSAMVGNGTVTKKGLSKAGNLVDKSENITFQDNLSSFL